MKKVFWFSRHIMTSAQQEALGSCEVDQYNGTVTNVHVPFSAELNGVQTECAPLKEVIQDYDIIAIVAPINLQKAFLDVAGDKPVIIAKNKRERQENGEFEFIFEYWDKLVKVEVVTERFTV